MRFEPVVLTVTEQSSMASAWEDVAKLDEAGEAFFAEQGWNTPPDIDHIRWTVRRLVLELA